MKKKIFRILELPDGYPDVLVFHKQGINRHHVVMLSQSENSGRIRSKIKFYTEEEAKLFIQHLTPEYAKDWIISHDTDNI